MSTTVLDACMEDSKNVQLLGDPVLIKAALSRVLELIDSGVVVGKDATRLRTRRRELEHILDRSQQRNPRKMIEQAMALLQLASGMTIHPRKSRRFLIADIRSKVAEANATVQSLTRPEKKILASEVGIFWDAERRIQNEIAAALGGIPKRSKMDWMS